jgi:hypothetical protein
MVSASEARVGWLLGLELPALAREVYPKGVPTRRWLEHYAALFDTVEVNYTFYRLPPRSAVGGWVEQTPPTFLFTVRARRVLTHMKRLTETWVLASSGSTSGYALRSGACRRAGTASSSDTPAGSYRRSVCATALARGRARHRRSSGAVLPSPRAHGGLDLRPLPLWQPEPQWQLPGAKARGVAKEDLRVAFPRRGLRLRQQRLGGLRGEERPVAQAAPPCFVSGGPSIGRAAPRTAPAGGRTRARSCCPSAPPRREPPAAAPGTAGTAC